MSVNTGECKRPKWAMMENDAKGHNLLGFQERLEMIGAVIYFCSYHLFSVCTTILSQKVRLRWIN